MFLFFINAIRGLPLKNCTIIYRLLIRLHIILLQKLLFSKTGLLFQYDIIYDIHNPDIILRAHDYYPLPGDWVPQFRFAVKKDMQGILLYSLKLPRNLRYRQIGSTCVNWLKDFCARFGFYFIVLGSYPESEGFWLKMSFKRITAEEWNKFWN